eukprot:3068475-Alexandrium_andersonii.AAC.1
MRRRGLMRHPAIEQKARQCHPRAGAAGARAWSARCAPGRPTRASRPGGGAASGSRPQASGWECSPGGGRRLSARAAAASAPAWRRPGC